MLDSPETRTVDCKVSEWAAGACHSERHFLRWLVVRWVGWNGKSVQKETAFFVEWLAEYTWLGLDRLRVGICCLRYHLGTILLTTEIVTAIQCTIASVPVVNLNLGKALDLRNFEWVEQSKGNFRSISLLFLLTLLLFHCRWRCLRMCAGAESGRAHHIWRHLPFLIITWRTGFVLFQNALVLLAEFLHSLQVGCVLCRLKVDHF